MRTRTVLRNFKKRPSKLAQHATGITLLCLVASSTVYADLNRARAFLEQGRIQEAITELEADISVNPNDAETRFLKGVALQALQRNDEAIEVYSDLVNDFPELPEPWNNLAVLWADKQEFAKAEEALRAAIKTNKSYATAHENLGDIYAQRASIAYTDALTLDPVNRSAVEIKLSMIDNILLPPEDRRSIPLQAAGGSTQVPTQTAPTRTAANNSSAGATPANSSSAGSANPGADGTAIRNAVMGWADAWSNGNVSNYLSHYAETFRPVGGASRAAWAQYRTERLEAPDFIIVNISDLRISNRSDGSVDASFVQDYQSDGYQDVVRKTLRLINTPGGWKIQREQSQPL